MLSCEPLDPTSTATTIRVRDGKAIPTDGPFADTKEQLGGIYVIDRLSAKGRRQLAEEERSWQRLTEAVAAVLNFAPSSV
jgi:hypothetical protein